MMHKYAMILWVALSCSACELPSNVATNEYIEEITTNEAGHSFGVSVTVATNKAVLVSSIDNWQEHTMEFVTAQTFSYEYTKVRDGSYKLCVISGNVSVSKQAKISIDGVNICKRDIDGCALFQVPLEAQKCDSSEPQTKPVTDPTQEDLTTVTTYPLATHEECWQCPQDLTVAEIKKADTAMKIVSVDIECAHNGVCKPHLQNLRQKTTAEVVAYANRQECFVNNPAREWQQALCDRITADAPDWFLKDVGGNPISVWSGMNMFNNILDSKVISGESFHKMFADEIVSAPDFTTLYDGVLLDNVNRIISWIMDWSSGTIQIDANLDGATDDPWWLDDQWTAGIKQGIAELRQKMPAGFKIYCRSKSHAFIDVCDGIDFEQVISNTDIPGGDLGKIYQALVISSYGKTCIVHHDYEAYRYTNDEAQLQKELMNAYALGVITGCIVSFDIGGDDAHGYFMLYAIFRKDVGVCDGELQHPYPRVYEKSEQVILTDSQKDTAIPYKSGDEILFWREIRNGTYGVSKMTGIANAERWHVGMFWNRFSADGTLQISYAGYGELMTEHMTLYRTVDPLATGYFYKACTKADVFWNVKADAVPAKDRDGKSFTLQPRGTILFRD